jgi:hypothetical protein
LIGCVTIREDRWLDPSDSLVTQTAPSPTAIPSAPAATGIGCPRGFPVSGSISVTVRSVELATHTAPCPYATPSGPLPTRIVCTGVCLFGSILDTVPPRLLVTQT